jgi:uncharacterized protein (TIGR02246 family)
MVRTRTIANPTKETAMTIGSENDTAAIKKILADQYLAWAAGDAERFVTDYSPDATVIMPGQYRRNRDEVRQSMANSFATALKGTSVVDEIDTIRFIGGEVAVAVSRAGVLFPGESTVPSDRFIHATWVFHKKDDRWQVVAYHNSPVSSAN